MEPESVARRPAQYFRTGASARRRGAAGDRDLCVGFRRGTEHSGRRSGLAAGQTRWDQGVRRIELDVDHSVDSTDDPQGRELALLSSCWFTTLFGSNCVHEAVQDLLPPSVL